MSQKTIPIDKANERQLRDFAESHLGMTLPPNARIETLRAKVAAAWNKEEIPVPVDAQPEAVQAGVQAGQLRAAPISDAKSKVKLIIQRTDEAGGDEPVPVGVNGKVMLIPRGEEVEVPEPYFEALKNAVKLVYDPLKDGGLSPPREVPMYPYQVLSS